MELLNEIFLGPVTIRKKSCNSKRRGTTVDSKEKHHLNSGWLSQKEPPPRAKRAAKDQNGDWSSLGRSTGRSSRRMHGRTAKNLIGEQPHREINELAKRNGTTHWSSNTKVTAKEPCREINRHTVRLARTLLFYIFTTDVISPAKTLLVKYILFFII